MRSLLFAPANRHDMIAKFPRMRADVFVLDLEDAVAAADRPDARSRLAEGVAIARRGERPHTIFVRINDVRSPDFLPDVTALRECGADGFVLPKTNSPDDIETARGFLGAASHMRMIAGIESISGVLNAMQVAGAAGVDAVYFGAEDFAAEMGARRSRGSEEVLYARSRVVLAAKARRILAIDQAVIDVHDDEQFRRDSTRGRDLGFDGKICLLPRQVELANELFGPSAAEIDHARRLIAAYGLAKAEGRGAIDFEGRMVDEVVLKLAQGILAAADRTGAA